MVRLSLSADEGDTSRHSQNRRVSEYHYGLSLPKKMDAHPPHQLISRVTPHSHIYRTHINIWNKLVVNCALVVATLGSSRHQSETRRLGGCSLVRMEIEFHPLSFSIFLILPSRSLARRPSRFLFLRLVALGSVPFFHLPLPFARKHSALRPFRTSPWRKSLGGESANAKNRKPKIIKSNFLALVYQFFYTLLNLIAPTTRILG